MVFTMGSMEGDAAGPLLRVPIKRKASGVTTKRHLYVVGANSITQLNAQQNCLLHYNYGLCFTQMYPIIFFFFHDERYSMYFIRYNKKGNEDIRRFTQQAALSIIFITNELLVSHFQMIVKYIFICIFRINSSILR